MATSRHSATSRTPRSASKPRENERSVGGTTLAPALEMQNNAFAPVLVAVLALGAFACDKSPEKAQQEAAEAQRQADMKQASAYDTADKQATEAQTEADKKLFAAKDSLVTAQQELTTKTEDTLGKMDARIIDLRSKLASAKTTKRPRAELEKNIDDLVAQLKDARTTLSTAKQAPDATAFNGAKARLDTQVSAIDATLSNLEKDV
ncbi:hypothetical protein BH09MYX1_BH09MYX1_52330 [soil metagenome]